VESERPVPVINYQSLDWPSVCLSASGREILPLGEVNTLEKHGIVQL